MHCSGPVGVRSYRDLWAWQAAQAFKLEVFRLVRGSPPASTDLRYRSQILRATTSVTANIAEGFLRKSPNDFARFLGYAMGSVGEAEERLWDGIHLDYFTEAACAEAFRHARRCTATCARLRRTQRDRP
jgi:four helix bundle protein